MAEVPKWVFHGSDCVCKWCTDFEIRKKEKRMKTKKSLETKK